MKRSLTTKSKITSRLEEDWFSKEVMRSEEDWLYGAELRKEEDWGLQ